MMSAPSAASARAIPSPMPLVEPVTSATFPFNAISRLPEASGEIIVQHRAEGQGEIDQQMLPADDLADRQVGQPAIDVRHQMQPRRALEGEFHLDILEM